MIMMIIKTEFKALCMFHGFGNTSAEETCVISCPSFQPKTSVITTHKYQNLPGLVDQ